MGYVALLLTVDVHRPPFPELYVTPCLKDGAPFADRIWRANSVSLLSVRDLHMLLSVIFPTASCLLRGKVVLF